MAAIAVYFSAFLGFWGFWGVEGWVVEGRGVDEGGKRGEFFVILCTDGAVYIFSLRSVYCLGYGVWFIVMCLLLFFFLFFWKKRLVYVWVSVFI